MKEVRRIVLVGFMGAGKTTVGEALARSLGWRFADLDREVEAEEGMSVAEIFAQRGEGHFRDVEDQVAGALLSAGELVLATGGGWGAVPGRLDGLRPGTRTVWLKVSPAEALRRIGDDPTVRPLLAVPDPGERVRRLIEERSPAYAAADFEVDTDGRTGDDVRGLILDGLYESGTYLLNGRA